MIDRVARFFSALPPRERLEGEGVVREKYERFRRSVFLSATIGYSVYYVCRLSLSVTKKPMVDQGVLSDSQVGMVGSALFFSYALGKLFNGFLADRSNVSRFMSAGLLASAFLNLALGFKLPFFLFLVFWGLNGWFQSMGAAPCVVSLSRWFSNRERGTYYGLWSASHSLGKGITFFVVAYLVSLGGWRWGFFGAGAIGLAGALVVALFLRDSPESEGLPSIAEFKDDPVEVSSRGKSVGQLQLAVLKNPYIWILALASSLMYVSRYGIESWGIYFLQAQKGYSEIQAGGIVSLSAVSGVAGTMMAGFISDRFFQSSRNVPVLVAGILNVAAIALFLYYPDGSPWMDTASMVLFGFAIGILITFLGGLMAVDIASKKASGTALGLIGIASYAGAGIQDMVSGFLIGAHHHTTQGGGQTYDFSTVKMFWLGAAALSVVFALLVWKAKPAD